MSLEKDFVNKLDSDWTLVGKYKNVKTPTLFRHNKCGTVYMKTPSVVLSKPHGCRFCNAKRLAMDKGELLKKAQHKLDRYEILSDPTGYDNPITIRHKTCGSKYEQRLSVFIRSEEGCPHCSNALISKKTSMTHEDFLKKLGDRAEEYEFLTKYQKAHEKIKVRHKCGNVFEITPDSMLRGGRCKLCKYSTGEGELFREVKKISDDAEQGNRQLLPKRRELDVYIPSTKIAVEYNGLRYHTVEHFMSDKRRNWSYSYASKYHLWKTNTCYDKGVRLIHIYEDEWLNKKEIVIDMIRSILHCNMTSIYARKTEVKTISKREADKFLEANHIQGKVKAGVYVALLYNNTIVAIQAYKKLRKSLGGKDERDVELVRYAVLRGHKVVGGFSKCMKWFVRENNIRRIVSYGDLRFIDRDKNVYLSNGFVKKGVCSPCYDYVKGTNRYHRFNFTKKKIKQKYSWVYDDNKTEKEMMRELGYERIYDCGKIRYEYKTP